MIVNFRYKAKDTDKIVRGLLFRADQWLETETRIPLSDAEELALKIETRVGDEFKNLEEILLNEAKIVGHMIPKLASRFEGFVEKELGIKTVDQTPAVETGSTAEDSGTPDAPKADEAPGDAPPASETADPAAEDPNAKAADPVADPAPTVDPAVDKE